MKPPSLLFGGNVKTHLGDYLKMKLAALRRIPKRLFRGFTETNDFHSVTETAKILGKDAKTIYYHIKVGNLQAVHKYGMVLVKGESINEFLKK